MSVDSPARDRVPPPFSATARRRSRAAGALLLLGLAACATPPPSPLRLGVLVFPPYELFFFAAETGLLPASAVRLVSYRSPAEISRAYETGVIDAMTTTLEYGLSLHQTGDGHRAVLVLDISHGADAVVARPGIASLAELRGRRIGAESGELGTYVLQRALDHAGLAATEVEVVPVDYSDQEDAYLDGRVDAVVTYDPVRSRLVAAGAHDLFTSREIPGEIVDVVIVRRDLLGPRQAELRALVAAWFTARERFLAKPLTAAARMAPREQLSVDAFLAQFDGVRLPDAAENEALLAGTDPSLIDSVRRRADRLIASGVVAEVPDLATLLDPSLVAGSPR